MTSSAAAAREIVAERSRLPVPSVVRCMLLILALKMALRIAGFDRTIRWIRHRVAHIPTDLTPRADEIAAVEHSVAMAGALYPGRALCLEQSFVLYYLLRRDGVAAKFYQGVQAHPFAAHAWVEYHGELLNDIAEHLKPFAPLPGLLP